MTTMFDTEALVSPVIQKALLSRVHQHTGIAMAERKWTLLHWRLRRRVQFLRLPSYEHYLDVLDGSKDEVAHFIDLVTTNETYFFRTPRIWQYLEDEFFPAWHKANAGATMNIWSAASSTGEEAYSLAMLGATFQRRHRDFTYRILGTDISQAVLDVAVAGHYCGRNMESLMRSRPEMAEAYLERDVNSYRVVPSLRSGISFRQHNLHGVPPVGIRFDLVLLRNVLIYFDEVGQEAVLKNVRRSMQDNAVLVIGESESLHRLDTGFTYCRPLIYRNEMPTT